MVVVGLIAKVKVMVGACTCRLEFTCLSFSNIKTIKETQLTLPMHIAHYSKNLTVTASPISYFIYFIQNIF